LRPAIALHGNLSRNVADKFGTATALPDGASHTQQKEATMHFRMLRLVVALMALSALPDFRTVAEESPAQEELPSTAAAEALAALDQAEQALARWQEAIEAGEQLRDEEFAAVKPEMEALFQRVQWLYAYSTRDRRAARDAEPRPPSADEQTKQWVDQMRAIGKGAEEKRMAAAAELRAALAGDNETRRYAALRTLQQIGDVNFDKASFRPLVLPLVKSSTGHELVSALYALYNTKREPGDVHLVQEAWQRRSPALASSISHLLFMYSDGKIEGRSEEIILEVLDSPEAGERREGLRGLWGASISDKLAARLVELADDPESHGDAVYFGLSTLKPKNEAVVDKLIETLSDSDWTNNGSRALWGLGYGVPKELQPKVAAAAAELYAARSDPRTREEARKIVRNYAGEAAAEALPK
jgi:hypothetical protein